MTESIQQPDINAELETLRVTNAELTKKSKTRKAKIEELEAANTTLQTELRRLTVDVPMHAMAESMSTLPDLFIEQFNKTMRLELIDGKPTIVNLEDGKPINVPFEREALRNHLMNEKHPQVKIFQAIVIASHASGGNAVETSREKKHPIISQKRFGLK